MYYFSTIYLIIFFLIKVSVFEFKTTNILILSHGPCLLEGKSAHILGNVSFFLFFFFCLFILQYIVILYKMTVKLYNAYTHRYSKMHARVVGGT